MQDNSNNDLILVTGASGMVGQALVDFLIKKGFKVVGCDLKNPPREKAKHFVFKKCDLANEKKLRQLFREHSFKKVVHLAALMKTGGLTAEGKRSVFQANIKAVFNLLALMEEYGSDNLVFASSRAVYGLPCYLPVDEEHSKKPVDFYGFSKLIAEQLIESSGLNYLILRFPSIFSFGLCQGALYNFVSRALVNQDIHITAKLPTAWEVIFLDDVVKAIDSSLMSEAKKGIFNIGYGEPVELSSMANRIVKLVGSLSRVINDFSVLHPVFCLNPQKSKNILKVNLPSLDSRLRNYIDFWKYGK